MKIMHLISGGDVGGAKTHVLTLLEQLRQSHQVLLVCFVDGPFAREAISMGIPTRVLRHKEAFCLRRELLECIRSEKFDLIHCHGAKANVFSAWIRRKLSVPVISTVHSDPRLDYLGRPLANLSYGMMNRIAMRYRDGWVAVSDSMKQLLISRGYEGDSIWPIYNGIVFSEKPEYLPRKAYLEGLGLDWDDESVIFGLAARIVSVKDLPTLVRAFAETVKQVPNAKLLIAGDGEQRSEAEELAKSLCPAGTFLFAGWQQDMNSFYHAVDVNVLSSVSETFPYAITEGARMRCATVATAVGGVPKVVLNGQTGFLVEAGDWEQMAKRMIQLAQSPVLRATLGSNLYEKVRTEYSSEAMARDQLRIYETVLRRYHKSRAGRYGTVICGAYGKGNVGDDSILMTMIRQLRQEDPFLPICVMSRNPRQTAQMTGVSSIPVFHVLASRRWMKRSSLYISGGGSLIQNATSNRSLMFYLFSIAQAKRCGCRVMMYGCGIGPVNGENYIRRTAKVLQRDVDLITLRDPESRQTLERFGVSRPEIRVTADPAMMMQADRIAAARYREKNALESGEKYCMFVLRPWGNADQKLEQICAAAEYAWKKHGLMPVLYCFEPDRDAEIARQASDMLKVPHKVLPPSADGAELCGLIAGMELVVGMRLHALIFACSQQTKVVGISYDPKVSGFLNYLGCPNCVELEQVCAETLMEKIDAALQEDSLSEEINRMKELAEENGRLAGKLLLK